MIDVLVGSPLLTLFLVVALGSAIGAVKLGPVRFGAAGALFVGLAVGALDPRLGEGLALVQSIGLALFVYTIGIAAGASFFRDLRTQTPLMAGATALLVVVGALAITAGRVLGLDASITGGMFAGMLTATPALAAATAALDGEATPAVGYAIAYPVGVLVTMLVLTLVVRRPLPGTRDPEPLAAAGLLDITVEIDHPMLVSQIPGIAVTPGRSDGLVRMSYLLRDGRMRVALPEDALERGDHLVLVGIPDAVREAAEALGHRVSRHLADDRTVVDFRRFVVSDPHIAGRTVAELRIPARFGGIITRIRRGDRDLLALPDMRLQLGDRVRVVVPRERMDEISDLFGDSEKKVTEVDFVTVGLGITAGVGVGLVSIPLGGGAALALGSAAGPLLVGLLLGRIERTGPLVWAMPGAANLTIRQLGLVLFLAAVGLSSGQAFASQAFTLTGVAVVLIAAVLLTLALLAFWALGRAVGLSAPRTAGAMAGFVGQPVLLSHVDSMVDDERTESGYSALFALGIIVKIIVVQVVVVL
ncbi:TrkA C-terminal domain-containing protein [Brachybacterium sp. UNK5269]|uniref:aspartate-alanine antiporter-like transporter n=1 Tax=Brachybacterium sp. UNK5269 TaxID=3408576 RepID=UPI003BB00F0A